MICNIIVTVTLMTSRPVTNNNQGTLEVKQYLYSNFIKASNKVKLDLLFLGASFNDKTYPKIVGVDLTKTNSFNCDHEGQERTF